MILLPRAAEELKIPFVASGGMADGRSLVAALALGADGMNMGTRFIATKEAPVHDNVKKAIVAASELDTRLIMRALRNTERVLKNNGVDRVLEIEREKGAKLTIDDIHDQVAGVYPKVMIDGDMDAGAWSCGMVAGLIHDMPTVQGTDRPHHGGGRTHHPRAADGHSRRFRTQDRDPRRLLRRRGMTEFNGAKRRAIDGAKHATSGQLPIPRNGFCDLWQAGC